MDKVHIEETHLKMVYRSVSNKDRNTECGEAS